MKIIISTFMLLSLTITGYAKEYKSLSDYKTSTGKQELNKRDWLRQQRENNTLEWQDACLFNLSYKGGFKQYETPEQRADFYTWYNEQLSKLGHEVTWPKMAQFINDHIDDVLFKKGDVYEIALLGSKVVFDSTFSKLQELYQLPEALKGDYAAAWDENILEFEQRELVQPIYDKLDEKSYLKLCKASEGKGIFGLAVPTGLEFYGYLNNIGDRKKYANTVLKPYVLTGKKPIREKEIKPVKEEKVKVEKIKKEKTVKPEAKEKATESNED